MRLMNPIRFPLVAMMIAWSGTAGAQAITAPPPEGSFVLRSDLHGVHPRLHFTSAQIDALRSKGKGDGKFFVERMKSAFGGYVGKPVNIDASWKGYLYGLWGQLSMNMLGIVEEDPKYSTTAKNWALHFARDGSWPGTANQTDDLIPQEIVTGIAMTYDILYDEFTPAERQDIRVKLKSIIDSQYQRFFEGSYWTNDFQNNHMHNRISGLGHAAIAIMGDDPEMDVQKHADLAYHAYLKVREWAPPDGSTHEGPGYWSYGYHWVTRVEQLFEHTTGKQPPASEHDRNAPYYPVYMLTPGMMNNYGLADTGGYGPHRNFEALFPAISRFQYEALHGLIKDQMQRNPDAFYQQTAWGLIWYDPTVGEQDYRTLPLSRVWTDLDAISVRSGWEADDVGVLFICGPPGGHHMQQKKLAGETSYINVAHDHPDQNHFMIWAGGKMLTDDDGYPKSPNAKLTASHNTILIDGEGGPREGGGWYQPFPYDQTAFMQDVAISDATAYAGGNASRLYEHGERFIRHFALVEGEYVMIIDDLRGAGDKAREFDWRLHKDGDWTKVGETDFTVRDGDVGLHVQFLAPEPNALSSSFFGASGTAKPGLSVKTTSVETQLSVVLTPQIGNGLTVDAEPLAADNGWAIRAQAGEMKDVFAVSSGAGPVVASEFEGVGSALLVRSKGEGLELALLARGTSLDIGGEVLLRSNQSSNLVWRPSSTGGQLEVEPPYKEAGGDVVLQVGSLVTSSDYCLTVDGLASGKVATDGSGVAEVSLGVPGRRVMVLEIAGAGTTCPTDPVPPDGGIDGIDGADGADGGTLAPDAGTPGTGGSVGGGGELDAAGDGEGCSCSTPGMPNGAPWPVAMVLAGLALLVGRRRCCASSDSSP